MNSGHSFMTKITLSGFGSRLNEKQIALLVWLSVIARVIPVRSYGRVHQPIIENERCVTRISGVLTGLCCRANGIMQLGSDHARQRSHPSGACLGSRQVRFMVKKETGETAHVERFNNTLPQRCANLVRKTLSFSKRGDRHELRVRGFVDVYNAPLEAKVRISQA